MEFRVPISMDGLGGLLFALGDGVALWRLYGILAVLLGPLVADLRHVKSCNYDQLDQ